MTHNPIKLVALAGSSLGGIIGGILPAALDRSNGLLVVRGLAVITEHPELLVSLSHQFGSEVENYRNTPTPASMIHESQAQILVISNLPPCDRQPPVRPDPPVTESGTLPVQFPLFYGVTVPPHGQGQTLFADGYAAYQGLPDILKKEIQGVNGLHALLGTADGTHERRKDGTLHGSVGLID